MIYIVFNILKLIKQFYISLSKIKAQTFILVFCMLLSCNNKNNEKKEPNIKKEHDNVIKNLNIFGYENNKKIFNFKSEKSFTLDNNIINADKTNLEIYENNKIILTITSNKSIYDKEKKIIESKNNKVTFKNKSSIISPELKYIEDKNQIILKKSTFDYNNIKINSEESIFSNKKIKMKKVSAKLLF